MVVVDKPVKAMTILQGVKNQDYVCDLIVVMDTITDDVVALANETSVNVQSYHDVLALGRDNHHDFVVRNRNGAHLMHAFDAILDGRRVNLFKMSESCIPVTALAQG